MSEISASLAWLKARLAGIAAGGVWVGAVPPGTQTPYGTIAYYGSSDAATFNATRLWAQQQWLIEFHGTDTQDAAVEAAAHQADAALQKQTGTVADGTVLTCVRLSDRFNTEEVGGIQWIRQGGVYETRTQQSS